MSYLRNRGIHRSEAEFRTARDTAPEEVCLISGEKHCRYEGVLGEVFDYYETEVQLTNAMFVYYFRIKRSESEELCYHRCGVSEHSEGEYYNFRIMPGYPHRHGQKALSAISDFCRPLL